MTQHWYALRVKPHKEHAVYRLLISQDITVYFPVIKVKPKNPRAAKIRPYFPGYMFVAADLIQMGTTAFQWTPGTRGLVAFGNIPAVVPENLIYELKKRVYEVERKNDLPAESYLYKKGEHVRIVEGLFAGYDAIFDAYLPGPERVQVLLAFLSQHPQPLRLDTVDIEKLH